LCWCSKWLGCIALDFRGYIELGVINDGDEIIVPTNTYIATILEITDNRFKPVLVESDVYVIILILLKLKKKLRSLLKEL
jgi:dTDP-4-amino-4,6-dideoxygalactose transaminase